MGAVAQMARLPILLALSTYYAFHQQADLSVKYATAALPQLALGEKDQPQYWDVEISCVLAYGLLLQKMWMQHWNGLLRV